MRGKHRKSRLAGLAATVVAIAAALVVAMPGGAAPAAGKATLLAGPVAVKDYKLTVIASGQASGTSLTLMLSRTVGGSTQMHSYSFTLPGSAYTVNPSMSSASLKTATALGASGKITMTFKDPGKLSVIHAQSPCTGSAKGRAGRLVGGLSFVADSTYFGTIKKAAIPAG